MLKAIFISLVIHLALLGLTRNMGGSDGDQKNGSKERMQIKVSIREKSDEQVVKTKQHPLPPGRLKVKHKEEKAEEKIECDKFYTGIGITTAHNSCMVTQVFKGYPAYKAGILAGDLIVSPQCSDIIGPENTIVNISILRGVQGIHLQIRRGKICENK